MYPIHALLFSFILVYFCLFYFTDNISNSPVLRWTDQILLSLKECRDIYGGVITENVYCGSTANDQGTCYVRLPSICHLILCFSLIKYK